MKLQDFMSNDMIITDLAADDQGAALAEIASFLAKKGVVSRAEDVVEKLFQREKLGTTGVGKGFAIPHCKIKGVQTPLVVLAVSRKGVEFKSLDGKPAHIVFLVVAPLDNPGSSLQVLAVISQLIRGAASLQKKLLAARNAGRMMDIIREEEERIYA
jgi:fructose-specific phosphotransferase system IIA component